MTRLKALKNRTKTQKASPRAIRLTRLANEERPTPANAPPRKQTRATKQKSADTLVDTLVPPLETATRRIRPRGGPREQTTMGRRDPSVIGRMRSRRASQKARERLRPTRTFRYFAGSLSPVVVGRPLMAGSSKSALGARLAGSADGPDMRTQQQSSPS